MWNLVLLTALLAIGISAPVGHLTANTLSREDAAPAPEATIADAGWLAGTWRGDFLGGVAEEIWSRPGPDGMFGAFRLMGDEGVRFYEMMAILEEEGSLTLRIRHFNPDLTSWEKDNAAITFPLVKRGDGVLSFEGLTIRRVDDDTLELALAIHDNKAGSVREERFVYRRVK